MCLSELVLFCDLLKTIYTFRKVYLLCSFYQSWIPGIQHGTTYEICKIPISFVIVRDNGLFAVHFVERFVFRAHSFDRWPVKRNKDQIRTHSFPLEWAFVEGSGEEARLHKHQGLIGQERNFLFRGLIAGVPRFSPVVISQSIGFQSGSSPWRTQ